MSNYRESGKREKPDFGMGSGIKIETDEKIPFDEFKFLSAKDDTDITLDYNV